MAASEVIFYFDEMMPRTAADQLALRGYKTVLAVHVGMSEKDDLEHLRFASSQGAVLVTLDRPFAGRAMQQTDHSGLICWTGRPNDIGGIVRALLKFAEEHESEDVKGRVFWLKPV